MRNSNGTKYLVILALMISVVALSLGFAAFTSTLTIKSSATVQPIADGGVVLSTSKTAANTGSVTPTASGATGAAATLTANSITGLKATFTGTNQTVTYTLAAYNTGGFPYYLNKVTFGNASGVSTYKKCTAKSGTTQSYVDSACDGISLSVKVGSATYSATNNNISSHSLATSTGEDVIVTITYANNSAVADGDFDVTFGDITLEYSTVD